MSSSRITLFPDYHVAAPPRLAIDISYSFYLCSVCVAKICFSYFRIRFFPGKSFCGSLRSFSRMSATCKISRITPNPWLQFQIPDYNFVPDYRNTYPGQYPGLESTTQCYIRQDVRGTKNSHFAKKLSFWCNFIMVLLCFPLENQRTN